MTDYFAADLHLGHKKVAEMRGFDDVDEHDRVTIESLLAKVRYGDRLFLLGDISSGTPLGQRRALELLKQNFDRKQLHLVIGNHETVHPHHSKAFREMDIFLEVFGSVQTGMEVRISGVRAMASHFPYSGEHGDDEGSQKPERFVQWRLRDLGAPIIHGHTHSTRKLSRSNLGSVQVCVSLDAWNMQPASKDEVARLIESAEQTEQA